MTSLSSVLVVGTGLIGTSIALAARAAGIEVWLEDADPAHVDSAVALGAGRPWSSRPGATAGEQAVPVIDHAVICVPPEAVVEQLRSTSRLARTMSDTSGIKSHVLAELEIIAPELGERFCGSHPMAGRERSGPWHARADLFRGRPWVLVPGARTAPVALARTRMLAEACGAEVLVRTEAEHDRAVATVSQLPQLLASALAARVAELEPADLALVGQGLRDMTRVAASAPGLWAELIAGNRDALAPALDAVIADLAGLQAALGDPGTATTGARATARLTGPPAEPAAEPVAERGSSAADRVRAVVVDLMSRGNAGRARLPGIHGGPRTDGRSLLVAVPDRPGELARALATVAAEGANVADLRMDHAPGRPLGVVEMIVAPADAERVAKALRQAGWPVTVEPGAD
ncbi:MAG: prephenate dehydrogenase [Frankiaceae bacterium]